jgi:hypothetical protein
MNGWVGQAWAAKRILHEMEQCGDVGEVNVWVILDALASADLRLEEGSSKASEAFIRRVAA